MDSIGLPQFFESGNVQVTGLVVADYCHEVRVVDNPAEPCPSRLPRRPSDVAFFIGSIRIGIRTLPLDSGSKTRGSPPSQGSIHEPLPR